MNPPLHPLLLRQMRRAGLDAEQLPSTADAAAAGAAGGLGKLLAGVSRAYAEADRERYLMERSQEISSQEMGELHGELQASQARLASLLSLSSDWVWEQDHELRFTYLSDHAGGAGSELAASLLGKRPLQELPATEPAEARTLQSAVAERRPFRNFTCGIELADGGPFFVRISGEPQFDGTRFIGYRGVGSDVTLATLAERRVRQLANYDTLTGLANRRLFMSALERAVNGATASGNGGLAVFFIDLDRFKAVNDSLGHEAGDELLKVMSRRLGGLLRDTDMLARLGGDEFVVLLEGSIEPATLAKVASRMLGVLSEPLRLCSRPVQVSASVGISLFPADGNDSATLLKSADAAMYLAKARGKNNFQFFTPELEARAARHFALESDLRQAMERQELRLHYQPRFDVATGAMCGMEALLRWQHPQRGLLAPGEFIDLAEESGLIVPIGRWVMEEACRQVRAWRDAGLGTPPCAINLSVRQFASHTVAEDIGTALAAAGLAPAALEVEITESVLMADSERTLRSLQALETMGINIAIDDFGTGYSSLAYLKRFPAHTLKIDRSFIKGLPASRDDAAITQAVIAMAHRLEMRVVAEGVETEAQLAFLREARCDEVQGFLLGRPLPPVQLALRMASEAVRPVRAMQG